MSQSDYIKYKRIQRELTELNTSPTKIPNVLGSGQYILYKQYSLENTIVKHNDAYDRLVPDNIPVVFGMVKQCADKSPTFTLCSNTNTRLNRNPVLPLDNDELPSFTYPKVETIPKNKRMKWNSIRNSDYCFCGNI